MKLYRAKLECGATLIGQTIKDQPIVLGCSIPYGAAYDGPRLQGAAHFLEHMLFKSKTNRRREEIEKEIDACGGDMNAYTECLKTVVHCCVPPKEVHKGARFICELVRRPHFRPSDLELERDVILIEKGMADDDPLETGEDFISLAMYEPPFGAPVRGTRKTIQKITSKHLQEIWQKAYHPSGFTFAFAGDTSGEVVRKEIEKGLENHELISIPYLPFSPPEIVPRFQTLFQARKGIKKTHLRLGYRGPPLTDPLYPAFCILDIHLAGGPFSALFREIREERGLAYRINTLEDSGTSHGSYHLFIGTNPRKVKKVCSLVKQTIGASTRLSRKRFGYARDRLLGIIDASKVDPEERMNELLDWEVEGPGAERYLRKKEDIQKVTLEDVRTVARKLYEQEPARVFISSPKFIKKYRAKYP